LRKRLAESSAKLDVDTVLSFLKDKLAPGILEFLLRLDFIITKDP